MGLLLEAEVSIFGRWTEETLTLIACDVIQLFPLLPYTEMLIVQYRPSYTTYA